MSTTEPIVDIRRGRITATICEEHTNEGCTYTVSLKFPDISTPDNLLSPRVFKRSDVAAIAEEIGDILASDIVGRRWLELVGIMS